MSAPEILVFNSKLLLQNTTKQVDDRRQVIGWSTDWCYEVHAAYSDNFM